MGTVALRTLVTNPPQIQGVDYIRRRDQKIRVNNLSPFYAHLEFRKLLTCVLAFERVSVYRTF